MNSLLEISNLSIGIRRGAKLLSSVEDVSFKINQGEILGIVGESGSGKSLTALSITGLLGTGKAVSSGSIFYNRADGAPARINLLDIPESSLEAIRGKEISMVFQEPFSSLNPLMKIGKQIAETLVLHENRELDGGEKRESINDQVRQVLRRLGFTDPEKLVNAYPHQLSGGMCQRAMIALAVICRPRLIIADEPTTALDRATQAGILSFLRDIYRDFGSSILFISHDLSLVRNFCSRVLVMYSGRILEEGDTEEVFLHPEHEYTRSLLGAIPGQANRGKDLANIPGRIPSLEEGRPAGCPFHPRCGKALPACREEFPRARPCPGSQSHISRCLFAGGPA